MKILIALTVLVCTASFLVAQDEFQAGESTPETMEFKAALPVRYLLYEVNPGEGFNLRRDVYMRLANMVNSLNDEGGQQWVLVLPPWGNIYHWQSSIDQMMTPWSRFFDLESLRRLVPVMELTDWMKVVGKPSVIDQLHYTQHYKEGWENGQWTERRDVRECNEAHGYTTNEDGDGLTHGWFWGYSDQIVAKMFQCVSVQNDYMTFKSFLSNETEGRSIMIHRCENVNHGMYSEWSKEWWTARRSMRFSESLKKIADEFRAEHLDSEDVRDSTVQEADWTTQQKPLGSAKGGPYMAVHLRRKDFLFHPRDETPSLQNAGKQISALLTKLKLSKVFVATDAPQEEFEQLKSSINTREVYRFQPSMDQLREIGDGGVAIVDQWIAAHARFFVGTSVSTFTMRIYEERSLLGFSLDSTYNRMCGDKETPERCESEKPTQWPPQYE